MSVVIDYEDFPALYRAADANSLKGQRRHTIVTRFQLGALVTAAAFGAVALRAGDTDVAAVLASVAFGAALVSDVYMLKERPDRQWYVGRAVAESTKTLTWRYLVGGSPLSIAELDDEQAADLLLARFVEIESDVEPVLLIPDHGSPEQVTEGMRRVRALPLERRRELYLRERIRDQQEWYGTKARWNERRATQWSVALATLELLGLAAGVLKSAGVIDIDLLGLAAALAAAGAAWVQTRQHQNLATAYALAHHELATIGLRVRHVRTEEEWASFVGGSEDAISREHTLWRASHS
ncbi:DUF4231 domain-containing protein [Streptomyces sp. JHA26]|uniref:DUF4231 domain-containing protein n=1 Tax=Streptomyces sp. JHA26 TaxID=1917143 RepID=UPI0015681F5E|nr:DUF4231 domain-containing protein [Streptomyces sp. JHA26]